MYWLVGLAVVAFLALVIYTLYVEFRDPPKR